METSGTTEGYDLESPEILQDPYPFYERVRAEGNVVFNQATGRWLAVGHDEVAMVLRDDDLFRKNLDEGDGPRMGRSMLNADPPDHTRLRSLVSRAFTARRVESLRERIETLVDDLLDGLRGKDEIDFIDAFAYPLPITVIAELLGVPADDHEQFRQWSYGIALRLGSTATPDPETMRRMAAMMQAAREREAAGGGAQQPGAQNPGGLMSYFNRIVEERRTTPGDDLITALIAAEEEGDQLNHGELIGMLVLLLVAGHETTVNLFGNGLNALLRNPDEHRRFRENPDLAKTAVEEFLRYDSPVQRTGRVATRDTEVGGKLVKRGQGISTLLGGANRDPDVYDNPAALDIGRTPNPHMSFAAGIHFCLGAQLARMEAQVAFPKILERFPDIRLATGDALAYRPAPILRGLEVLPVKL